MGKTCPMAAFAPMRISRASVSFSVSRFTSLKGKHIILRRGVFRGVEGGTGTLRYIAERGETKESDWAY